MLFLALIFFSCSNSYNNIPDKTYKVTFNIYTPSGVNALDIKNPPAEQSIATFSFSSLKPVSGYQFNMVKLGSDYTSTGNYYYFLGADDTKKIVEKYIELEEASFSDIGKT